jgi:hypothetical protein
MKLRKLNNKGMVDTLVNLAFGAFMFIILVTLAVTVGNGLGSSAADCSTGFNYSKASGLCQNNTNASHTATASLAAQTSFYTVGQLGSAGLSGYLGLIFIAAIAIGIISMLGFNARKKGKY